jgi:hypothetical protein
MKTSIWITICIVSLVLGVAGGSYGYYRLFPCPPAEFVFIPEPEEKPHIKQKPGRDPYYCGKTIAIDKVDTKEKDTLRIKASNDCMDVYRNFKYSYTCPKPKSLLQIGIMAGINRIKELKRVDGLLGGNINYVRFNGSQGIGGGPWFLRGITSDDWAVGGQVNYNFMWGKQQ